MDFDGKKIADEIARRCQSVPEFAVDAQLSRFAVYRALSGGKASTKTLGKIAGALGVERPTDLLRETQGKAF